MSSNKVAIIGIGLRVPGANNLDDFWENLATGKDCLVTLSDSELLDAEVPQHLLDNPNYVKRSSKLDDIDMFDADFFDFTQREARKADPQLRLLLEVAYECIENSGNNLLDSRVGVYVGAADHKYWLKKSLYDPDTAGISELGTKIHVAKDYFASQISYNFNLTGPSISLSSACSSALLAVHEACSHILMHDCDYAIAGGCEVVRASGYLYEEGSIESKDGVVRAFDKNADGTVFGSGVGLVMLKRLDAAVEDGDNIYGIISGSGANNDGNRKAGYSAPSVQGQADVIHEALLRAGVSPEHVSYVETHGTATSIGDPIEIEALSKVFDTYSSEKQYCAIGSVKTNLGHLSYAAGIVGLVKAALCLTHKKIPASLHFQEQNSNIEFANTAFYVNTELKDWLPANSRRYAGVSAFGIGGTNVHMVLEEAPDVRPAQSSLGYHLFSLSAKTKKSLSAMCLNLAEFMEDSPDSSLEDVAFTLNIGRPSYPFRWAGVCDTRSQLVDMLREASSSTVPKESVADITPPIVFMFPGQGAQYLNMGKELYSEFSTFRAVVDECVAIANEYLDCNLLQVIYPSEGSETESQIKINQTAYTQPAIFTISYALSRQLALWGIKPDVLIGHSLGEYTSACLSGIFSLRDAVKLVCIRGQLMQGQLPGEMISVAAGSEQLESSVLTGIDIAAINSPHSTVLSGESGKIKDVKERLARSGIKYQPLQTSHAYHSRMMDPILDEFESTIKGIQLNRPSIRVVSNVSGDWLSDEQATDPDYWVRHLRSTVRYSDGVSNLDSDSILLEMGPSKTLSGLTALSSVNFEFITNSMRRAQDNQSDINVLLSCLGDLWRKGIAIDWAEYYKNISARKVPLPTYPFQRESYWFDTDEMSELPVKKKASYSTRKHSSWDPLLGRLVTKSSKSLVYENTISEEDPSYLVDHKLLSTTIFPGAGYVCMAISVARELLGSGAVLVNELRFEKALMLLPDQAKNIQIIGYLDGDSNCVIQITSGLPEDNVGQVRHLHAQGSASLSNDGKRGRIYEVSELKETMTETVSIEGFYESGRLIKYGKSFQALEELYTNGSEALAKVSLPLGMAGASRDYAFHPVLLDACFQATDILSKDVGTLPICLKNLILYAEISETIWIYVVPVETESKLEQLSPLKICILNESGILIAEIGEYIQGEITDEELIATQSDDLIFNLDWMEQKGTAQKVSFQHTDSWLVLSDAGKQGQEMAKILECHSQYAAIFPRSRVIGKREHSLGGACTVKEFEEIWIDFDKSANFVNKKIIYLWAFDDEKESIDSCVELVNLVKALSSLHLTNPPHLFVLTVDAQPILQQSLGSLSAVDQSALWGLCNTLSAEHPELNCVRIDLDPNTGVKDLLLLKDLSVPTRENQIAYRNGLRYVPRLIKAATNKKQEKLVLPSNSYAVGMSEYGTFDDFFAIPQREYLPAGTQVHVKMYASAINFKETLIALGLLRKEIPKMQKTQFGLEGAGKVVAVGQEVDELSVGDDVIVWHSGCLASDVIVDQQWLVSMPSELSYLQAAVIPTVFMTAYHALYNLAELKRGDRILIHAAAGGVGQAAVQIAKHVGAEIYATSSKAKWPHLESQGINFLMDSRSLKFTEEIFEHTSGNGVDVVLNSLSGEYIRHSIDALGHGGRFVEIGKIGIWSQAQMSSYRSDVNYYPFELGEGDTGGSENYRALMSRVLRDFVSGIMNLPPIREFDVSDVKQAFRFLASGKSIGKVALSFPDSCASTKKQAISQGGCYLITGAFGGIGLRLAQWLADKGASRIVLLGRSKPDENAKAQIEGISDGECDVEICIGDVSSYTEMKSIIDKEYENSRHLSGIFHCAGTLEDGILLKQSEISFAKVFKPKVDGARVLHKLTKGKELEHFVCFSSISSVFDGAGQSNYAAANAYLDGLMHYRHQQNLPSLSINWGGWSGSGMTASLLSEKKISADNLLQEQEAFSALEKLLIGSQTQAVVVRMGNRLESECGPLFDELQELDEGGIVDSLEINKVIAMNPENSFVENALQYIQTEISEVLGINSADEISAESEFSDMGIDSLMLIELKNRVQAGIGENLPIGQFFANPTPQHFSRYLDEEFSQNFRRSKEVSNTNADKNDGYHIEDFCFQKEVRDKIVFCLPGINDNILEFKDLSERLENSHSVQVLQFVNEEGQLPKSLNDLAALYVEKIISLKPDDGYSVIGFSYGGTIAVEIASQLIAAGKKIDLLLMVDAAPHFNLRNYRGFLERLMVIIFDGILKTSSIEKGCSEEFSESIRRDTAEVMKEKFLVFLSQNESAFNSDTRKTISEIIDRCVSKIDIPYSPPKNLGTIDVKFARATRPISASLENFESEEMIKANKKDEYGWKEILGNTFSVTKLDCDHNSVLSKEHLEPIVKILLDAE